MIVRRADLADRPTVQHLRLRALADAESAFDSTLESVSQWTSKEWEEWTESRIFFLLEHEGETSGLVAAERHWTDSSAAFLVAMWMDPDLRGTGGSDQLVNAVLAWARSTGLSSVWLHVGKRNQHARALYERCGFRTTGVEFDRDLDGLTEIEMTCAVERPGDVSRS